MTRRTPAALLALSAALAVAGCSGGSSTPPTAAGSTTASTAAPSPLPAATTTDAPADLAAQQDCEGYELAYGIVRTNVASSDQVLGQAVRMPTTPQLEEASSKAGAAAEGALAQLAQAALMLRIAADGGKPLDRAAFTSAWDQAKSACLDVGYHFSI